MVNWFSPLPKLSACAEVTVNAQSTAALAVRMLRERIG
jgi:hypothetical protein